MKKGDYVRRLEGGGRDELKVGSIYQVKRMLGDDWLKVNGFNEQYASDYFEPVKVAVHCKTEDEWKRVQAHLFNEGRKWTGHNPKEKVGFDECDCIYLEYKDFPDLIRGQYSTVKKTGDYHIISAQEYLGEGDVEKIKVGDYIEITGIESEEDFIGETFKVIETESNGDCHARTLDGGRWCFSKNNYKLSNKQNNIKGEDKMEISNNVFEVFDKADMKKVQERFGDQYGDTDRDLLALRRDKKDLLAIIKKEEEETEKKFSRTATD